MLILLAVLVHFFCGRPLFFLYADYYNRAIVPFSVCSWFLLVSVPQEGCVSRMWPYLGTFFIFLNTIRGFILFFLGII